MLSSLPGRWASISLINLLAVCDSHAELPVEDYNEPARFEITSEVVNQNLQPFTATIGGFGNSFINVGSGFEPIVFRNKYIAEEDSPDRVIAAPDAVSTWDTLREGMLDGAEVRVYRIENGRFVLVRQDHIPDGGFHVSGWHPAMRANTVVLPNRTYFRFRWDDYNRPGVPYYFTVRAVDHNGNVSPAAEAISVIRPDSVEKNRVDNAIKDYRASESWLDTSAPAAPTNLRGNIGGGGTLLLEWDPVQAGDLAGYIVYRSDYPPEAHRGFYLQLSSAPMSSRQQIKTGDMVIVSKTFYDASRKRYHSNRVWGARKETRRLLPGLVDFYPDEDPRMTWELVRHEADSPVQEAGETFMRLKLATNKPTALAAYNHSGTGQSWYDVLETKTYKVEVWLRQKGQGRVRFKLTGFFDNPPHEIAPIEFRPGLQWRKFSATFKPPVVQPGKRPNRMALEFAGPATFDVDNFRVYRADTDHLDYTAAQYAELERSGMQALRTHGFVKTGRSTYDMTQLTNPGGVISRSSKLNTLPQTLAMMRQASVRPWLQIEPHMSPEEWLAFVEYMAASYDPAHDTRHRKPWAYKRYSQGQVRPWVEEFEQIWFELGNETWNNLFRPWIFEPMTDAATGKRYSKGQVYGLFQEHVRSILRSSPHWERAGLDHKVTFILGGWNGFTYGSEAASTSPSSAYLTVAGYNGGWDEAEGPPGLDPVSFYNLLNQVSQSALPRAEGHAKEAHELNAERQIRLRLGTYEAGPGYALDGLNNVKVTEQQMNEQEQVMKSLAAGTATMDSFLVRAYLGYETQNFFTFGEGTHWKSHAKWYHGAQAYPSWKLLALFNRHATGDMLMTKTLSVPRVDLQAFKRREEVRGAALVATYATRKDNRFSVFVISRKVPGYPVSGDDGYTPVTLDLPFNSAASITLYKMTGDPRMNNIRADNVKVEKTEIPPDAFNSKFMLSLATGADERGLPPASTFLYVFEVAP